MLQNLIYDKLSSELYDAILIGYKINVEDHYHGLDIEILGFSDKISKVLDIIIENIVNLQPEEEDLEAAKQEIK